MSQSRRHSSSRVLSRLATLVATALVAGAAQAVPAPASALTVAIDPGHGGIYNHAFSYRLKEKHVNLWLGLELRRQLQAAGIDVVMTRDRDVALTTRDIRTWNCSRGSGLWSYYPDGRRFGDPPHDDLQARVNVANAAGADLFVSIHNNASRSRRARGTETWAAWNDTAGRGLGSAVQRAVVQRTGLRNRGAKAIDFYVLKWSNMPAVLIEGGFITNRADARLLSNPAFRRKLVAGMVTGIQRWLATDPYRRLYPRHGGETAADVAVAASLASLPGTATADTVLLASSSDATTAMTAAPLARRLDAPLLLADASGLATATAAELARLKPSRIIVIATESGVPPAVASAAADAAGTTPVVERIAGADVYETAALLAERVGVPADGRVVIASCESFAGALSASSVATGDPAPVLLAAPGLVLPASTSAFLAAHAAEVSATVVVGTATEIWDGAIAALPGVTRIAGVDAYSTNAAVLRSVWPAGPVSPLVAPAAPSGSGLVAAALGARTGRPVVLSGGRVMSAYTREWISNAHARAGAWTIVGTDAEQPNLVDRLLDKAAH